MVENTQVSRYNLVLEDRSGRYVDSVAVVGYDDDRALKTVHNRIAVVHIVIFLQEMKGYFNLLKTIFTLTY